MIHFGMKGSEKRQRLTAPLHRITHANQVRNGVIPAPLRLSLTAASDLTRGGLVGSVYYPGERCRFEIFWRQAAGTNAIQWLAGDLANLAGGAMARLLPTMVSRLSLATHRPSNR